MSSGTDKDFPVTNRRLKQAMRGLLLEMEETIWKTL